MIGPEQRASRSFLRRVVAKATAIGHAQASKAFGYPVLYNVNKTVAELNSRRALLIYLVEPFRLRADDARFFDHQNLRQCVQIARVLGEAGYIVDVADVHDERFFYKELKTRYDLILSHRVDLNKMGENLPHKTTKVYLATGMNHFVYNKNLLARYERLRARRSCELPSPSLNTERMPFVYVADAVVGFGNDQSVGTWKAVRNAPIFSFNNYGFDNTEFIHESKDFAAARRHFVFFASRDQIRKGLDLLLEIFPRHPNLHLHICSLFASERQFCDCYRAELYHTPNIHALGIVPVNSNSFYELVRRCAFVILPSCEEGQPGSVVQMMHAGLIPLVTRECGIDVEDFGWQFENDREEEIERLILYAASLPAETVKARASLTRQIAMRQYGEKSFVERWREIVAALQTISPKERIA